MSLAVRHVSKAFGGFRALDDVSLELEAADVMKISDRSTNWCTLSADPPTASA